MVKSRKYPAYKYILAVLDWFAVSVSLWLGFTLRQQGFSFHLDLSFHPETVFVVAYGALSVLIFQHFNLYKLNVFITIVDHSLRLAKALSITVLGIGVLSFFTRASWVVDSRLAILYFALIALVSCVVLRVLIFRNAFLMLTRSGLVLRNVAIIGTGFTAKNLAVSLQMNNPGGIRLVGFIDDALAQGTIVFGGIPVIGRTDDLKALRARNSVQEIIICLDDTDHTRLMNVVEKAASSGATVKISSPLYNVIHSRLFIEQYGDVPVVNVHQTQPSTLKETYKRVFDLVLTSLGLVLAMPVFTVIAVFIKLDSPGPVFFKQTRIGRNGKPFKFYKFRSMIVGSEQDDARRRHATQFVKGKYNGDNGSTKIVNETRITKVGKWLRKTSLDELPQLINVLRGEMSLVGPRPCLPYEWEHYEEWHKKRLSVTPGCTGMWQVSGRSAVGFDDMVVLDLYYIHNASLLLDLRLLLKTIPIMLLGIGAK